MYNKIFCGMKGREVVLFIITFNSMDRNPKNFNIQIVRIFGP